MDELRIREKVVQQKHIRQQTGVLVEETVPRAAGAEDDPANRLHPALNLAWGEVADTEILVLQ